MFNGLQGRQSSLEFSSFWIGYSNVTLRFSDFADDCRDDIYPEECHHPDPVESVNPLVNRRDR